MSDVFTNNQEVLVAHANARLNLFGRRLLVERVIADGRPVAHVAKELGISRQCAHRWVARFRADGEAGLLERSSRPHRCPRRTPALVEQADTDRLADLGLISAVTPSCGRSLVGVAPLTQCAPSADPPSVTDPIAALLADDALLGRCAAELILQSGAAARAAPPCLTE